MDEIRKCDYSSQVKATEQYMPMVLFLTLYKVVLKRPSHVKLMLANSCWQSQIGACERHNNMLANCWRKIKFVSILANFSPTVCQHVVMSFTHTNLNLPTRIGQH